MIDHRPINILLVEDCRAHAIFFTAALRNAFRPRHHIDVVESLAAAFEKLADHEYDLVALDLGLPESQGLETLDAFFERVGNETPVIVLTANEDHTMGEESLRRGSLDFLVKGQFGIDQLARGVRYALERSRRRIELAKTQQSLKSFAHAAAHDLKSPLKSISAYSEILRDLLDEKQIGDEATGYLEFIIDFSDQAERLVDGLLHFSVIGENAVNLEPVDLATIASQAARNLAALVEETRTKIKIDPTPPTLGDADLLMHVFQNLIGNGIKYRRDVAPRLEISAKTQGAETVISVSDNGIGIDQKYLKRIFEPFKRVATGDGTEGFGLGLAICQRIVEGHHGRITVESQLGRGSIFRFTLPSATMLEAKHTEVAAQAE